MLEDFKFMAIISIIVAMGNDNVIGIKNSLPWKIPADLEHFKKNTFGKPVIMGEKTFESIGKALPGRKNIVLTFNENFKADNSIVVFSIDDALKEVEKEEEVMIIGGASIYKQFLPLTDRMYLTLIHSDFGGDCFFPNFNDIDWIEKERKEQESDGYKYDFIILERKR
jgi:dihydrofolate reductase